MSISSVPFERTQLLESLTVPQLRDIALTGRLDEASVNGARTKDALKKLIQDASDQSRLWTTVHRLEALIPFKHMYLFAWKVEQDKQGFKRIAGELQAKFNTEFSTFKPLEHLDGEFRLQTGLVDGERQRLILKFVHTVDVVEWKTSDEENFRKDKRKKRHPFVVVLRFEEQLATVSFPGYTQGTALAKAERLPYQTAVFQLINFITGLDLGLEFEDIAIKAPLEFLLENIPEEISNAGRTIKQAGSGLSVNTAGDRSDVVSAFISLFPSLTPDQVKEALQSTEASGMLLLWKKLGIFTRINLREGSTDILFIWKTGGASSVYTERIIQRLWEGIQAAGQPQFLKASEALRVLPAGEVIRVSSLMQLYSLRQADSAKLLLNGLKSGLLEMRFRIRTDNVIENFDNIWRTTLEEFPRSVVDETGDVIDLSDPTNIDVAYERVRTS